MDEFYERIQKHKIRTIAHDRKTVATFKAHVKLGKKPQKCLFCYELGINYCRFWEKTLSVE